MFPITLLQYFCNSRRNGVGTFRRTPPRTLEEDEEDEEDEDAARVADWPNDDDGGGGNVDRGAVMYNLGDIGRIFHFFGSGYSNSQGYVSVSGFLSCVA